jgi:hypothetical protein
MFAAEAHKNITLTSSGVATDRHGSFQLLQLPETALDLVLQQLDSCSLASMAATCSRFRHVLPAYTRQLNVRFRSQDMLDSFTAWLQSNSSSMPQLTQCTAEDATFRPYSEMPLQKLPCPQLRQLHLKHVGVQLEYTGLTGLTY